LDGSETYSCLFHFENSEKPNLAYIKHWESQKYVHPKGGWSKPWNNNKLVVYDDYHASCLFRYLEEVCVM
jgi:hypothetical protein